MGAVSFRIETNSRIAANIYSSFVTYTKMTAQTEFCILYVLKQLSVNQIAEGEHPSKKELCVVASCHDFVGFATVDKLVEGGDLVNVGEGQFAISPKGLERVHRVASLDRFERFRGWLAMMLEIQGLKSVYISALAQQRTQTAASVWEACKVAARERGESGDRMDEVDEMSDTEENDVN